jgi:outer membrane immunogenic protein
MRMIFRTSVAALALLTIASAASAADMAVKAPPAPPPPPPFSWTGFYIGGNVGGAWAHGNNMTDNRFGLPFNGNNNGVFIAGGEAGFNYQFTNLVIGFEGDFDWAANSNNSGAAVIIPGVGTFQVTSNNRWIATVAGRFGLAYDRWFFYGKGGGGWVGSSGFTVTNLTTGASISGNNNNTLSGWLVGAGIEWAFASNWSGKIEYDFLQLNSQTFSAVPLIPGDGFNTGRPNIQMVKFGINYRFGWTNPIPSPVTARY